MQGRRGRGPAAPPRAGAPPRASPLVRQLRVYILLLVVAVGGVLLLRSVYSVTKMTSQGGSRPPPRVVSLEERSPPPPPAKSAMEFSVVEEVERIAELIQTTFGSLSNTTPADDGYMNAAYEILVRPLRYDAYSARADIINAYNS